ncbi:MAG: hypothetical protein FWD38_00240 [Oscillospiraceae bacterium]|nr:hypothetical protein [Oscillospiraceae bacterium]
MKKIIVILLVLVFILSPLIPGKVSANPGATRFEIGSNIVATRDRQLVVPVSVTGNPDGFAAVGLEFVFNPAHLQLKTARLRTDGVAPPSPTLRISAETDIKDVSDGTQWISIVDTRNLADWSGEGVLMNLTFDVVAPSSVESTTINMDFTSSPNGRPVNAETGLLVPNVGLLNGGLSSVTISASEQGPGGQRPEGHFGVTIQNPGTGATGQGWYLPAAQVPLFAGTPAAGQTFNNWTLAPGSPNIRFANANNATTTFPMPAQDITVIANWNAATTYSVTVNSDGATGASGAGQYAEGATVNINAGTRAGWTFVRWTMNPTTVTPASATTASTSFTMPARNVVASATWRNDATGEEEVSSGGGGGSGSGNEQGQNPGGGSGSGGFGNVPQTNVADIGGTMALMAVSITMTAVLGTCLFFHLKSNRKRTNYSSTNGS